MATVDMPRTDLHLKAVDIEEVAIEMNRESLSRLNPSRKIFICVDPTVARQESISELRRRALGLTRERVWFTAAHELAHEVLHRLLDDQTGMADGIDLLNLLGQACDIMAMRLPRALPESGITPAALLGLEPGQMLPLTRLDPWSTGPLAKLGLEQWLLPSTGTPTLSEPVQEFGTRKLATSSLDKAVAAYARDVASLLVEVAAMAIGQIDDAQAVISRELSRRLIPSGRHHDVPPYALSILAACRRYGRRSEPDDHAVLPMRRYPTTSGAAACA
jgi:hypothetical protein